MLVELQGKGDSTFFVNPAHVSTIVQYDEATVRIVFSNPTNFDDTPGTVQEVAAKLDTDTMRNDPAGKAGRIYAEGFRNGMANDLTKSPHAERTTENTCWQNGFDAGREHKRKKSRET